MTRAWDKEKSESPTGIEPMTSWTPGGLITTHDEFGSADPSSMQDTCHIWTQCSSWVLLAECIERPPGVWEVRGSIPVGDSDFSLSHAHVMLNISSFKYEVVVLDLFSGTCRLSGWHSIHPSHAHLHLLLGQLVRSLWWLQPRSHGDFPGLGVGRGKGGCGASRRSTSAAFFKGPLSR